MSGYNDNLDPSVQLDWEEWIAAKIWDGCSGEISEGDANDLGREILFKVLRNFRPDLVATSKED